MPTSRFELKTIALKMRSITIFLGGGGHGNSKSSKGMIKELNRCLCYQQVALILMRDSLCDNLDKRSDRGNQCAHRYTVGCYGDNRHGAHILKRTARW